MASSSKTKSDKKKPSAKESKKAAVAAAGAKQSKKAAKKAAAAAASVWSCGLPDIAEQVMPAPPPGVANWTENMLFAIYDPACDIGMWLHLGTMPSDWTMWEDRAYVYLPGDGGILSILAYTHTPPEQRPGGANINFRCIEPWKKWKVTCDGVGVHTTNEEMQRGLATLSKVQRFTIDLDIEFISPVWDAHTSTTVEGAGAGSMDKQDWAKEHYEQLYKATGTVTLTSGTYEFNGYGWRDHSRGPRGTGPTAVWGGHIIAGGIYPESGRTWGICRYWTPAGEITLEGGFVYIDGVFHHAKVVKTPRLRELKMADEHLPIGLKWDGGEIELDFVTRKTMYTAMAKHLCVGTDLEGAGLMYVLNHGPCDWDGETGIVYCERSDPLNAFPENLFFPDESAGGH
jgi:hypothetical protein